MMTFFLAIAILEACYAFRLWRQAERNLKETLADLDRLKAKNQRR